MDIRDLDIKDMNTNKTNSKEKHQANSFNLLDTAPIGLMTLDLNFNVIRINRFGSDMLATTQKAIEGRDIRSFVAPLDQDSLHRHLQLVARRTVALSIKVKLLKANGELLHTQWWSKIDADAQHSNEKYLVVSFADITAQALNKPLLRRKNAFQRTLIDQSPFAIFSTDINGVLNTVNPAAERMFGYSARELTGKATPLIFMLKEELSNRAGTINNGLLLDHPIKILTDHFNQNGEGNAEWTYVRKNGTRGVMLLSIAQVHAFAGAPGSVIFEAIDISEQKRQERVITGLNRTLKARVRDLHQAKQRSEATLMAIADGVVITDEYGKIETANSAAASLFDANKTELVGRYLNDILHFETTEGEPILEVLDKCINNKTALRPTSSRKIANKDGHHRHIEETIAPITTHYGQVTGAVLVFRDVTDKVRLIKKVIHQATHDELTGLHNRRYFNKIVKQTLLDLAAAPADNGGAMMVLDLDHFKAVNDSCGHLGGDALLCRVSSVLRQSCPENALVARIGGDEFAIFLRQCSPQSAYETALTIIEGISTIRFEWEGKLYRIGVSIGLALTDSHCNDPVRLQSRADNAAYTAKRSGRNRVHIYEQSGRHLCEDVNNDWFNRINRAVDEDHFKLYTQKIQALSDVNHFSFEFLIRLHNADDTVIMPDKFIPMAERYNLMSAIDRWVANNAFQWLHHHAPQIDALERCSINISATSFSEDGFCAFIEDQMRKWQVPCTKICFELTETDRISDIATTASAMAHLKKLGCKFSLDDFGAGYTSFELLKTLPVDYVKIDGKLVREAAANPIDYIMVKSICDISTAMGTETIAEYVDSEQVLSSMQEIGVDYVQGFYIDKPRILSEFNVTQIH